MTLPDDSVIKALAPALVDGLHQIGTISQSHAVFATEALAAISVIYETLRAGLTGELSPEAVTGAIGALKAELAANNAVADKIVHDRFDGVKP